MDPIDQKELFQRYLDGTATPEEIGKVEDWYAEFDKLDNDLVDQSVTDKIGEEVLGSIFSDIHAIRRKRQVRLMWSTFGGIAATILMIFLLKAPIFSPENAVKNFVVVAADDGKLQLTLPDSSHLWLNEGAGIRYVIDEFGSEVREIWLDSGEVFFDVKSDQQIPFLVHSGSLQTKVLGTAFNIKTSGSDKEIQVTVAHGRVRVSDSSSLSEVLTKGDQLEYNTDSKVFLLKETDPLLSLTWKDGERILRDADFESLQAAFYSLYDLRLETSSEMIKNFRYTLKLSNQFTYEESLEIISAIHGTQFTKHNGTITMYEPGK